MYDVHIATGNQSFELEGTLILHGFTTRPLNLQDSGDNAWASGSNDDVKANERRSDLARAVSRRYIFFDRWPRVSPRLRSMVEAPFTVCNVRVGRLKS